MNYKKWRRLFLLCLVIFFIVLMKKEVKILKGVNRKVHTIKMPAYVKILDFVTRHNHYALIINKILQGKKTDNEKLLALFAWTKANIKPVPAGFPLVDDHVDSIIVRGYGTPDQSADVFTTLAVFAGFNAGMYLLKISPENIVHTLSLVEIDDRLLLFDTYYGFLFYTPDGKLAALNEIIHDISIIKRSAKGFKVKDRYEYERFFEHPKPVLKLGWTKADLQMISKRLFYTLGRLFKIVEPSRVFYGDTYS